MSADGGRGRGSASSLPDANAPRRGGLPPPATGGPSRRGTRRPRMPVAADNFDMTGDDNDDEVQPTNRKVHK